MLSFPSLLAENRGEPLEEFESKSTVNSSRSLEFSPAREFSETLPRLSPGYEDAGNMFYFFYKIIFCLNKKKDDIRSAYVYFNFIRHKTVNSHNLEFAKHIVHVTLVLHSLHSTMKRSHLSTNQNARSIQYIS